MLRSSRAPGAPSSDVAPTRHSGVFADRVVAGRELAAVLGRGRGADSVVVGLPRGGVVVAVEVARLLEAPLDVIVVRKLGLPFQPELAMGAIGEGGVRVLDPTWFAEWVSGTRTSHEWNVASGPSSNAG